MNIGNIEAAKTLDIFEYGKNISNIQKGKIPRFNHR
tara:strand:- start:136 stop:243 length:108 start_codon:yes stop_codon:yes gene_type:complete